MSDETKELTPLQARFCDEYIKDLCGSHAAIRAGYSVRTARQTAHELLHDESYAHVQDAVARSLAEQRIRLQVDADYVIRNLTAVVDRCMQRAPVMVKDGKDWVQAKDEEGRDIWQFDAKGANGALTLLGKHLGMYIDKKEITLPQGTGVLAVPLPIDAAQWASAAKAQQDALTRKPGEEKPQ